MKERERERERERDGQRQTDRDMKSDIDREVLDNGLFLHTHTHKYIHTHSHTHTNAPTPTHTPTHIHAHTFGRKKGGKGPVLQTGFILNKHRGPQWKTTVLFCYIHRSTSMTKHLFLFMSLSRIHIYNTCIHIYVTLSLSIIIAVFTCHSFALMSSVISLFLCILLSASFRKKWFAIWFSVLTTFSLS